LKPLYDGRLCLDEVTSTQTVLGEFVRDHRHVGVVIASHQTNGKGRFDRKWYSAPGEVLAMSIVFDEHPRPYLVGMACALAVAEVLDCKIQWPNDVVVDGKKVAGILTEIKLGERSRRLPTVGIGINLNQLSFPEEITARAASLRQRDGVERTPEQVANEILEALADLPTPQTWTDLQKRWMERDATVGKRYRLNDGRIANALGVGPEGELDCEVGGQNHRVYAGEALFGNAE
jgi:BirA family biotin operon repressor/biotin-[acetyl-CoA-carboxylase] ligase